MPTDRELIEAAVAAGKVRVMPAFRGSDDPDTMKLAVVDVKSSPLLALLLLTLQDGGAKTPSAISMSIRQRRLPSRAMPHPNWFQIERGLLALLAKGMVAHEGKGRQLKYKATRKAPKIDADALRAHLVRLAETLPRAIDPSGMGRK